jgi:hypothetical protein
MTESQWAGCADPQPMLDFLQGKAGGRKLRLFGAACCRALWGLLPDERSREAVRLVEQSADGEAAGADLERARVLAWQACGARDGQAARLVAVVASHPPATLASGMSLYLYFVGRPQAAHLLRDLFGPRPFRPVAVEANARTGAVVALARGIYNDRRFEDLPVLADALEEAGCADPEILTHLRGPGPHVRGCWCVDLLLSKA